MLTLYDLNMNASGIIKSFNNSNLLSSRLSELGLVAGSKVRLVKITYFRVFMH